MGFRPPAAVGTKGSLRSHQILCWGANPGYRESEGQGLGSRGTPGQLWSPGCSVHALSTWWAPSWSRRMTVRCPTHLLLQPGSRVWICPTDVDCAPRAWALGTQVQGTAWSAQPSGRDGLSPVPPGSPAKERGWPGVSQRTLSVPSEAEQRWEPCRSRLQGEHGAESSSGLGQGWEEHV